ncbi:uncharacterized protein LOC111577009, partial [Tachysurus ichikawai]
MLSHLKSITDPLLDPLQLAYRANSSAFNTIIPSLLHEKLSQLSVPDSTCSCTSNRQTIKLLKFVDDTTLIELISDGDESAYRREISHLVTSYSRNNQELNTEKNIGDGGRF